MPIFILGGTFRFIEWNDCAKIGIHNEPSWVVLIFNNKGIVFIQETSINLFFKNRQTDYSYRFWTAGGIYAVDTIVKIYNSAKSDSEKQSTQNVFHNSLQGFQYFLF